MFDHITLRVPDLATASSAFASVLHELQIEQTAKTPNVSVWGNFALTQTDDEHPGTRRVQIAFIAPTPAHAKRFRQAGIAAGFIDDGPALKDSAGNRFEAVHHDRGRPKGNIDHATIGVNDVEASTAFYSTIAPAAGLTTRERTPNRAAFSVGASDVSFVVVAGEPTQSVHVAFSGDDDDVRRFHADATAAGYRSNGEPGERPRYHDGYYAAYALDPDGNNIEVVNHHR
jgi:catechol 2,3-dioxygenase-like lactoylglutathione lyase family enzyme